MTRPRPGDGKELDVFEDWEEDGTLVDGEGGRGEALAEAGFIRRTGGGGWV